ncbi:MAG: hypothetical protein R2883_04545 [Caldisericia bacterium]
MDKETGVVSHIGTEEIRMDCDEFENNVVVNDDYIVWLDSRNSNENSLLYDVYFSEFNFEETRLTKHAIQRII